MSDILNMITQTTGLTADALVVLATAAWAVSEALSLIPWVKSNGLCQLLFALIRRAAGK